MNTTTIIEQLRGRYPGKKIIEYPTEILCEIEPTEEHADYSVVISVIDKSIPHVHKKMTEIYTVLEGELILHINDETIHLKSGDTYTIIPNQTHLAQGDETWIVCEAVPGWTKEDHILV